MRDYFTNIQGMKAIWIKVLGHVLQNYPLLALVMVWPRQVDVFLRYTRVIQATNERVQFHSFEAGVHQIVHESWLW